LRRLWKKQNYVGQCPKCKTGELTIIFSRATFKRFVGCSNYRNKKCDLSFPLPQKGRLETTDKLCNHCGHPLIKVYMPGRRPWNMCVNWLECPGRLEALEKKAQKKQAKAKAAGK
jgi:DNA topoisomerase-1